MSGTEGVRVKGPDSTTRGSAADSGPGMGSEGKSPFAPGVLLRLIRFLFDPFPVGILLCDASGGIVYLNPAAERILGLPAGASQGVGRLFEEWDLRDLGGRPIPREELPHIRALRDRLPQGEQGALIRRPDGTDAALVVYSAPLPEAQGEPTLALTGFRDVTARIEDWKALEASERKSRELYRLMRLMCDNVPDLIWAKDRQKHFLFVNRAICEQLLSAEDTQEPLGRTDLFFAERERRSRPEDPTWHTFGEICVDSDEAVMRRQAPGRFEEWGNVRGKKLVLDVHKAPFRDEAGEMIGTVGCGRDVTREKEIETALRTSEVRYRSLFEQARDAVLVLDARTRRVLDANRSAERLFRRSREELLRLSCGDLHPGEERERCLRVFDETTRSGLRSPISTAVLLPSGESVPVELTGLPLDIPDGPRVVVAQMRDVSEQRRLQAQLVQAQKMQALGSLAGGLAHDLNNILAPVVGFAEMGAEGIGGEGAREDYFRKILAAGLRARDVVRRLLSFARPEAGHRIRLDLNGAAEGALRLLREVIPTSVILSFSPSPEPLRLEMDPVHLEQILMNLCVNSAQAMPEGGEIRIALRPVPREAADPEAGGDAGGRQALLSVEDDGPGIPDPVRDRVFDPFFTTRGPGEGTGLGLSVVHALVSSYGGTVRLDSPPGRGARFEVRLPLGEPETAGEPSPPRPTPSPIEATQEGAESGEGRAPGDTPAGAKSLRVLVVEDEPMIALLFENLLRGQHHRPEVHTDSARALEAFLAGPERYDLLLTDQVMPNLRGTDLAERVRSVRPDLPILFVSGWSDELERAKVRFRPCEILPKPVARAALLEALERLRPSGHP